jgi:hypothetical protein
VRFQGAPLNLYKAVDIVIKRKKVLFLCLGDEQRMMLGLRRFTKYTNMPNIVALREVIITTKLVAENTYCFNCRKFCF